MRPPEPVDAVVLHTDAKSGFQPLDIVISEHAPQMAIPMKRRIPDDRVSPRPIHAQGVTPDIEVLQDVPAELRGRAELRGEASMRGHLSAEGAEQTGSQSYVPPAEKDDKALGAAYNLLRGVTVNANVPSSPKAAVPN